MRCSLRQCVSLSLAAHSLLAAAQNGTTPNPPTLPNLMKEKMSNGEPAYTFSIRLGRDAEFSYYAATAGYDGVFIDMEHSSVDMETASELSIAALYAGITPLVRVPSGDRFFVSRVLDGGALGVIIPHIRSVQDAEDVVDVAKFQPIGRRSSNNGLPQYKFRNIPTRLSNPVTNNATLVIPMIETLEALDIIDELAAIPGVDSLLVGTNDLTAELGIPGQYDDPRVTEIYQKVIDACKKHGKFAGVGGLTSRLDLVEKFLGMGASWAMGGTDSTLLLAAATDMGNELKEITQRVLS